jgi:hypothetical protein
MPSRRAICFDEQGDGAGIAVVDVEVDPASFGGLDGEGAEVSGRDGVHPQAVAEVVQVGDLVHLLDHAQSAEGVDGLVFRAFEFEALVAALGEGGHASAGHEAFGAGVGGDLVRGDRLAADLLPVVAGPLGPVFCRGKAPAVFMMATIMVVP